MFFIKEKTIFLFSFIILGFYPVVLLADLGISIASGHGLANIVPFRVGCQKMFKEPIESKYFWPLWPYVEDAYYSMNGKASQKNQIVINA